MKLKFKKPEKKPKYSEVEITLSAPTAELIQEICKKKGLTLSQYIIGVLKKRFK